MDTIPRAYKFMAVACCIAFVLGACSPLRPENDESGAEAVTSADAQLPTVTPITAAEIDLEEQKTKIAALLPTVTTASENTPAPVEAPDAGAESATDVAEGGMFLLPTVTPFVAQPQLEITALSVNVRRGPGTMYEIIDLVEQGERFQLLGRNEAGDWWQACCFDGENGWLFEGLVTVQNAEAVDVIVDIPPTLAPSATLPVPQQSPEAEVTFAPEAEVTIEVEATVAPAAEVTIEAQPQPQDATAAPTAVAENAGTAGDFNPDAQYQIVNFRVLGFDDNNGGIFNSGGQHFIFVTVLDENGNGVDGAVVKDAVGDKLNAVVGNKGPGKAEITMYWDPYKLYIASDPTGAVTSQVSNQMNTAYPHIPDIVGMLGPADNEYAVCPTVDDRCEPPFYHAHWSYEITFQKVR